VSTSESGQAASKGVKKDAKQKSSKPSVKVTVQKAVNQPSQPSKPAPSKGIKASESAQKETPMMDPIVVKHTASVPDEPPKRSIFKGTFNTHDIMHAPVEKTIQMLDKILAGERLFTM
jgi:hypothetical protein